MDIHNAKDREELKALAERSLVSSPAPWTVADGPYGDVRTVDALGDRVSDALLSEDAEFHAAANPAVVLSLLAALEEAHEALKQAYEELRELEEWANEERKPLRVQEVASIRRVRERIKIVLNPTKETDNG